MFLFIATPKRTEFHKDPVPVELYANSLADAMEIIRPGVEVRGPYPLKDTLKESETCSSQYCECGDWEDILEDV